MKKYIRLLAVAVALLAFCVLVACTQPHIDDPDGLDGTGTGESPVLPPDSNTDTSDTTGEPTETTGEAESAETDTAAATDTDTVPETTPAATEPVTLAPRYDYMGEEVAPNVTLDSSAYANMTLTLPASLRVTDEDVADYIEFIRFDYRTPDNGTTQMKDQPMKLGDDAFIYYKGVLNGEEFEGGSNWDDTTPHQLGLGSATFIPGFEEGLVGIIPANATRENPAEVHVTFPADYGVETLNGKEVIFYVAVEYAVQYTLPVYDRAFVETTLKYEGEKSFYASDKAFLDEFADYIRAYLESQMAEDLEYAKTDALWTYLTETAEVKNHPQLEMDYYFNAYKSEIESYYEYYKSMGGESFTKEYPTFEDFAKAYVGVGKDDDWSAELSTICRSLVEKDMIIHAIAEREGLESVTEEEYKAELKSIVDYYQGYMTEADILAQIGEQAIRETVLVAKMQAWLLERVTFTYAD